MAHNETPIPLLKGNTMFKSARTTAEYLMPGDKFKVGGRPMIIVFTKPSFYMDQVVVGVRSVNGDSTVKVLELETKDKYKVYNAK